MATKKDRGKTNIQVALSVYGKTVLCTVMSLFVYFSVVAIFSGLTPTIGERVYPLDEEGQYILDENGDPIYEDHLFEEGTSTTSTTTTTTTATTGSTAAGETGTTTTTTKPQSTTMSLRGDLSVGARVGRDLLIQALTGIMFVVLVYTTVWPVGDKDSTLVPFDHKAEDKWRGLKIGCLAVIPAAVLYVAYVVLRIAMPASADLYTAIYCWLNLPYMPLVNAINTLSPVWETVLMAFPLLVVPAVTWLAYALGYRQIMISEKFLYVNGKKKKKKK